MSLPPNSVHQSIEDLGEEIQIPVETRIHIIHYYLNGESISNISEICGVSNEAVQYWIDTWRTQKNIYDARALAIAQAPKSTTLASSDHTHPSSQKSIQQTSTNLSTRLSTNAINEIIRMRSEEGEAKTLDSIREYLIEKGYVKKISVSTIWKVLKDHGLASKRNNKMSTKRSKNYRNSMPKAPVQVRTRNNSNDIGSSNSDNVVNNTHENISYEQ